MVYRIDNRPKKHRGRYTILGIVLGIALTVGGIYVYDNYKQPILDTANQIKNTAVTEVSKPNPVTQNTSPQSVQDNSQNVQSDNQPVQEQTSNPVTSYSLTDLQKIALDDINNYRVENGLTRIILDNAKASQVWADHLLSIGCIQHRDGNLGPMQRYVDNGDKLQMVFENISGGYGTNWATPIDAIKQANSDMINNDADQNNAHRNNILNPNHNSVSIGIAYDSEKLIIVEDFQEPIMPNWKSFDMSYDDSKSCW